MERVLIIDDEYRIGLLIKSLIHWADLKMENLGVLDNSEYAWKKILNQNPDIVITDIRMPKIDGLELIKMTREAGLQTKFIVISGYKEFTYAQQAINFGVEDYILKPVKEDELNKVLVRVKEKLETESKAISLYKNYMENIQSLRNVFMNHILKEERLERLDNSVLNMDGAFYCGFDIKLDYLDLKKKNENEDSIVVEKVYGIVEDVLNGKVKEYLICRRDALHIYCLINYDEMQKEKVGHFYEELLFALKEYLIGFERYRVTIGVGREKEDFNEMRCSLEEAYRAVCNRVSMGSGRVIFFQN